ncbi:hypothetical protein [Sphaerimonospora thailandensis]|uniref:Uncharacterized protein n=1 Tax=Sphaerimonospora thailandensis TaxID=795644 RepID=A0A8J3R927_9ACTN|nr:hypothetical protein [Sphaerimonospora thailandensis]GIH70304.1 hypothetical protein Mth01_25570 [Sphaerimonospora thailandensis]
MTNLETLGRHTDHAAKLIAATIERGRRATTTGAAAVILGDLLDVGWRLPPNLGPTPPDPDRPGWHLPRQDAPAFYRDLDPLAQLAYDAGKTPRQVAIKKIALMVSAWFTVRDARAKDPAAFPGWPRDLSAEDHSRRILGALLDTGLTPPADISTEQLGGRAGGDRP